jgi:hypothetical protein
MEKDKIIELLSLQQYRLHDAFMRETEAVLRSTLPPANSTALLQIIYDNAESEMNEITSKIIEKL